MPSRKKNIVLIVSLATFICAVIVIFANSGSRSTSGQAPGTRATEEGETTSDIETETPGLTEPNPPSSTANKAIARKQPSNGQEIEPLHEIRTLMMYGRDALETARRERGSLIRILKDHKRQTDWYETVRFIAMAGESDESSAALIDFATRDVDQGQFSKSSREEKRVLLNLKANVGFYLGFTRGDAATEYLRKAITVEGAKEVAEQWIHNELEIQELMIKEHLYRLIRGRAAMGLAMTLEPENVKIVRDLYTEHDSYLRAEAGPRLENGAVHKTHNPEHAAAGKFYGRLVEALAMHDLLQEVGSDGYFRLRQRVESSWDLMTPYMEKYLFKYWKYE